MYILNTNMAMKSATTQFTGVEITSMAKFSHEYFATTENGLVKYSGEVDNITTVIPAYFITATMDFGINNDKRLRYLYLSIETNGNIKVDIWTEKVASLSYTTDLTLVGQQDVRIPISRALYGRFWTFKVSNVLGSDFSIDEMKIQPIIRNHAH